MGTPLHHQQPHLARPERRYSTAATVGHLLPLTVPKLASQPLQSGRHSHKPPIMSQHALSDQQVDNELRKMTAFIKQEAMEKSREIEIKANEEFEIEKSKLVRQETDAIDSQYEKKLKGLILEGFHAMNESELQIRARKADYDVVKKAIADAEKEYKKDTGRDIKAVIHEEHPLPEGSAGGVNIIGGDGKIDINNTFEARLDLLKASAAPAVREALFGKNPNRKFYD